MEFLQISLVLHGKSIVLLKLKTFLKIRYCVLWSDNQLIVGDTVQECNLVTSINILSIN
jgi:hypothetical protein